MVWLVGLHKTTTTRRRGKDREREWMYKGNGMHGDRQRKSERCVYMCRDLDVYIRKDTRESTDTYKSKKKARDELPYWWPECHLLSFALHSLSTYNDKSRHVHGPAPDPITTLHRRGVERSLRFAILAGLWSSGMILLSGRRGLGFDSLNQSIHPSTIAPCRLCLLLRLLPPRRHRRLAQQQPQHGQSLPAVHRGGCGCGSSSGDVLLLLLFSLSHRAWTGFDMPPYTPTPTPSPH